MKYDTVLLKLSGESLMGSKTSGIDDQQLTYYAGEIAEALTTSCAVGIVIGGGNIYRGLQGISSGMDRVQGDYMGMFATIINGMALQWKLEERGIATLLLSGIPVEGICKKATTRRAKKAFVEGKVVIFAGGTGNPFFTTDTAAALRAAEIHAQVLLKGTRVDGVYSTDPEKDPKAVKFTEITFNDAIRNQYKILDITAFTMCMENHIPIIVFNINQPGNLKRLLTGENIGTIVKF